MLHYFIQGHSPAFDVFLIDRNNGIFSYPIDDEVLRSCTWTIEILEGGKLPWCRRLDCTSMRFHLWWYNTTLWGCWRQGVHWCVLHWSGRNLHPLRCPQFLPPNYLCHITWCHQQYRWFLLLSIDCLLDRDVCVGRISHCVDMYPSPWGKGRFLMDLLETWKNVRNTVFVIVAWEWSCELVDYVAYRMMGWVMW